MDPSEARFVQLFFTGPALERSLVALTLDVKHAVDPIAHVVLQVLSSHIQVQLTATGLQPIAGRALLVPWYQMTAEQREFLLMMVRDRDCWHTFDSAMLWRRKGAKHTLDAGDVLEAICRRLLASKTHADPRARLALCNIVLQRVQASLPLSGRVQAGLNKRLFGEAGAGRVVRAAEAAPVAAEAGRAAEAAPAAAESGDEEWV